MCFNYNMPKISIITPTYNSDKFIKRTINSVLNQTYQDWEYLIVDDSSTDNTTEIINDFIKKDKRIRLYKTIENSGGPARPKNIALAKADGEYIAFLDHDDCWLENKLEEQLNVFNKLGEDKTALVYSYIDIRGSNFRLLSKHKKSYSGDVLKYITLDCFILTSSCALIKAKVIKEVGFFDTDLKIKDDWDMWLKIAEAGYNFNFVPINLTSYISHELNSNLNKKNKLENDDYILIYEKHFDTFLKFNLKAIGHYYFCKQDYKKARIYFFKNIFSYNVLFEQRIKSVVFLILSFFPKLKII